MQRLDLIIILLYLALTMLVAIYADKIIKAVEKVYGNIYSVISRKKLPPSPKDPQKSSPFEDLFIAGRNLPWYLAGTSMAATTFSIDTPLYICGVVAARGIAGNWEWWSFGISHVILIYLFARMWRRSRVTTDAELTELRYGGSTAAALRATKAFLFAVPINCIGIGYAMLAMVKVMDALQVWQSLGIEPGENLKLWSVIGVSAFVTVYCSISGLKGVVLTDFFQFFLALLGASMIAVISVNHVGGVQTLLTQVQQTTDFDVLSFFPITGGGGFLGLGWSDAAGISLTTFSTYLFLQWWAFRRSDGGGEFVQRLIATKNEKEAESAAWFFNILNYFLRTWPWVVTALAAIAIYPNLSDPELGYPKLMLQFLPVGILGLVAASLLAAFMSTVSTSINWGASYLTNDLYLRFFPSANDSNLMLVGRLASVFITCIGAATAFFATDITTVFRLVIAIGTGPGLVLILRWFWWRVNATAEIAAMLAGFFIGLITSTVPGFNQYFSDFGLRLVFIASTTAIIWVVAMLVTPPESDETLDEFYRCIRPGGIGWKKQRDNTGLAPASDLKKDLLRTVFGCLLLFGGMFTIGGFLLLQSLTGWIALIVTVISGIALKKLSRESTIWTLIKVSDIEKSRQFYAELLDVSATADQPIVELRSSQDKSVKLLLQAKDGNSALDKHYDCVFTNTRRCVGLIVSNYDDVYAKVESMDWEMIETVKKTEGTLQNQQLTASKTKLRRFSVMDPDNRTVHIIANPESVMDPDNRTVHIIANPESEMNT